MTNNQKIIIAYVVVMNCFSYLLMGYDKIQSKRKGNRVSENTLFLAAFILGATGVYLGMKIPLYHKAAKAKFKIGIPLIIVMNAGVMYYVYTTFK